MGKSDRTIIELEQLEYGYNGHLRLFKGLNFSLKENEKIGLIGENGSGKTTLLHLIVGILKTTGGNIRIFDQLIESEKDFTQIRQKVGLLFQNSDDQLFCPTVMEDVAFGPLNLGLTAKEAKNTALETLEQLNLKGFENRVTHELSGGEKKLVALATVLAMKPSVLLLDEPTSGLDVATKSRLSQILSDLEISYIMVSHEYDFLFENTDRIFGLKQGEIQYHGRSSALHSHFHSHPAGEYPHHHED